MMRICGGNSDPQFAEVTQTHPMTEFGISSLNLRLIIRRPLLAQLRCILAGISTSSESVLLLVSFLSICMRSSDVTRSVLDGALLDPSVVVAGAEDWTLNGADCAVGSTSSAVAEEADRPPIVDRGTLIRGDSLTLGKGG
jgi:hypothetical protein